MEHLALNIVIILKVKGANFTFTWLLLLLSLQWLLFLEFLEWLSRLWHICFDSQHRVVPLHLDQAIGLLENPLARLFFEWILGAEIVAIRKHWRSNWVESFNLSSWLQILLNFLQTFLVRGAVPRPVEHLSDSRFPDLFLWVVLLYWELPLVVLDDHVALF